MNQALYAHMNNKRKMKTNKKKEYLLSLQSCSEQGNINHQNAPGSSTFVF
jgi:hypothetical protein